MAKAIKNKVYNEFWEDENLAIKKVEKQTDEKVSSEEIKKLEKKLTKKVSGLEKEIKELKEETKTEEIQPVNKPKGWHVRNEFIDDNGNKFFKGKFVGKVETPKMEVKSDERKMEVPKEVPKKIREIKPIELSIPKIEPTKPPKVLTDKDIYQQYITDKVPFKIFFRSNLIFDSKVQPPKNYPVFQDDGFILFGKNYIYRGIRIEKY